MNSLNIIRLGDSESEFSGSIALMEIPEDISSGSSVFGEQEFIDDTFLVPKPKKNSSKKKFYSKDIENLSMNSPAKGITFKQAIAKRYKVNKPIRNIDAWNKKILEFKRDNFIAPSIIPEKFNDTNFVSKNLPVVSLERISVPKKFNTFKSHQLEQYKFTNNYNYMSINSSDSPAERLEIPLGYLPVVALERIQVSEKVIDPLSTNVNSNSIRKNSKRSKASNEAVNEKLHKCEQCNYQSKNQWNVKRHMLTHTHDYAYVCSKCPYKTRDLDALRNHVKRNHNGEFPYSCSSCSLVFTELFQLSNHKCFFGAEKLFECNVCKKRLSTGKTLTNHKRSYHSVGTFICSFCREVLEDKYFLELHQKSHRNNKTYICNKCTFKTWTAKNLREHFSQHC